MDSPTTQLSASSNNGVGQIRIGRMVNKKFPTYPGFTVIKVMTKSYGKYWQLCPYFLRNESGQIHENIWQFSKVYESVPESRQTHHPKAKSIVWQWPAEIHVKDGKVTPEYYKWRESGFNSPFAVRYPVGIHHRHHCLYSLNELTGNKEDYITSRKNLYVKLYCDLVKDKPLFRELKQRLNAGENLLICEVDGPHMESLKYYCDKYGLDEDFIVSDTMLMNQKNSDIMLNDALHPYGHGYSLAVALLDLTYD